MCSCQLTGQVLYKWKQKQGWDNMRHAVSAGTLRMSQTCISCFPNPSGDYKDYRHQQRISVTTKAFPLPIPVALAPPLTFGVEFYPRAPVVPTPTLIHHSILTEPVWSFFERCHWNSGLGLNNSHNGRTQQDAPVPSDITTTIFVCTGIKERINLNIWKANILGNNI